jgi:hypothetical protein
MDIFEWQAGFACWSNLCERDWCLLHRLNPKKIVPVDMYSLIATFEGISVATAKAQVGKRFGMKLGISRAKGYDPRPGSGGRSRKMRSFGYWPEQECPDSARHCADR